MGIMQALMGSYSSAVAAAGDPYWNDVVLLMDGTSITTDLSSANQTVTEKNTSTTLTEVTGPYGTTRDVLDFSRSGGASGIQVSSSPIVFGSDPFSIEMWVQRQSNNVVQYLYSDRSPGPTHINFRLHSDNKLMFFKDHGGGGLFSGATALTQNQWHHVALTYDGSTVRMFLDGSLDASSNQTLTFNQTVSPVLGYDPANTSTSYQLEGYMAHVRVTKGVARHINTSGTYTYPVPTEAFPTSATSIVPSEHFKIITWTGDGTSSKSVTGVGFQPEFIWAKSRAGTQLGPHIYDPMRGTTSNPLAQFTSITQKDHDPQVSGGGGGGGIATIDADGFTITSGPNNNNALNENGTENIAWILKAGGWGGVSNNDGSLASTVSANVEAGFSVVTFNQTSSPQTIGHGLSQAPELIFTKDRVTPTASPFYVYSSALGPTAHIGFNNIAKTTSSTAWNNVAPTSSVFSYNLNTGSSVAWCFHSVPGFSKVGSYTGDGGSSNSVNIGFSPAFLMIKQTDTTDGWVVLDNVRDTSNPRQTHLFNATQAEGTTSGLSVDFEPTGFTLTGNNSAINATGGDYIFLAFAS